MKVVSYAAFVLALASTACGSDNDDTSLVDEGKVVSEIDITPDETGMDVGSSVQFHATVEYADGTTKDVTSSGDTLWNSSAPSVATVSAKGMVKAVKVGAVKVSATFKGEKGDESFVVTP